MKNRKLWLPLILLFVFFNSFFLLGKNFLIRQGIDNLVLSYGNFVLFIASALSFYVSYKSITSGNPNSSVRSLYGSFMIKFFLIAVAAFVYIMVVKKNVNKPALVTRMGLYLVYSFVEVASLQKLLRQKKAGTVSKIN
jgi:ACR3 family arsenite efflux pump ArsB